MLVCYESCKGSEDKDFLEIEKEQEKCESYVPDIDVDIDNI